MGSIATHMTLLFVCILIVQSYFTILSCSKTIIKILPGYDGDLPFKLETGYVGVGKKKDVQLFYYFVESTRNPEDDPLIFYIPGGPGGSALLSLIFQIGPLILNINNSQGNTTLMSNPNAWTQVANIVFMDIPTGTGFSYAETKDGWISSDNILSSQAKEFIRKFVIDHPKFLKNPLYIAGISYVGIVIPKITLELYEGNERGDQPTLNIQGYILCSPLTDKFMDFNSRLEYAHRMALISDEIYKSSIKYCHGNYVNIDTTNLLCANSLRQYEQCVGRINLENILEPFCDDQTTYCHDSRKTYLEDWANTKVVQQALNIRQGKIQRWETINNTIHYHQGKNDTFCYSYDIFSSFAYHKKLSSKNCRLLVLSGDHDMTFPIVGVEKWIADLNVRVEIPWNPFYVDGQIVGYEVKYAQKDYSLTFATVKGAGHIMTNSNPKESFLLMDRWFSSQIYSIDS